MTLLGALALSALTLASPCNVQAQDEAKPDTIQNIVKITEFGEPVTVVGEVISIYDNELALIKGETGFITIHLKKEHWELGLQQGYKLRIKGIVNTQAFPQNDIFVKSVKVIDGTPLPEMRPLLSRVSKVQSMQHEGTAVAVMGKISKITSEYITITDSTGSIRIHLGTRYREANYRIGDAIYGVIGVTRMKANLVSYLDGIAIFPFSKLKRTGDDLATLTISQATSQATIGDLVKVKGNILIYIGADSAPVLFDEKKNLIVIELGDKYKDTQLTAGMQAEVIGTYDMTMIKEKEYPVLRNARIDRVIKEN